MSSCLVQLLAPNYHQMISDINHAGHIHILITPSTYGLYTHMRLQFSSDFQKIKMKESKNCSYSVWASSSGNNTLISVICICAEPGNISYLIIYRSLALQFTSIWSRYGRRNLRGGGGVTTRLSTGCVWLAHFFVKVTKLILSSVRLVTSTAEIRTRIDLVGEGDRQAKISQILKLKNNSSGMFSVFNS